MRPGLLIPLAALTASAHASTADVETLLAKMRAAYHAIHTARFDVESIRSGRLSRIACSYSAPKNFRATFTVLAGPPPSTSTTLICDGKFISIDRAGLIPRRLPYAERTMVNWVPANLETICLYDWDLQLSTAAKKNMNLSSLTIEHKDWNGRHWIVLREWAPRLQILCHYYIDPQTYLMWRTTQSVGTANSDTMDSQITSLKLNVPIPAGTFKMPPAINTAPKGAPVRA